MTGQLCDRLEAALVLPAKASAAVSPAMPAPAMMTCRDRASVMAG